MLLTICQYGLLGQKVKLAGSFRRWLANLLIVLSDMDLNIDSLRVALGNLLSFKVFSVTSFVITPHCFSFLHLVVASTSGIMLREDLIILLLLKLLTVQGWVYPQLLQLLLL